MCPSKLQNIKNIEQYLQHSIGFRRGTPGTGIGVGAL